jgi:uncharacterized protein
MELTVATILVTFAGVFLICFMKGAFGGGFSIVGIPLLSIVMDPVTAGGLLAPLFIAMDLFALRYWKPTTWSRPDLLPLLPGLVTGIGLGYLLFRFLDHRAIAIAMAAITLIFVALWLVAGAEVVTRPRSTPKALTAGLASGVTTMVAHSGGPPLAMYLLPLGLSKDVADRQRLDIDGALRARHSRRRVGRLAAARKSGPASDLSRLLRTAGRDGAEIIVGRRVRLSRVNFSS